MSEDKKIIEYEVFVMCTNCGDKHWIKLPIGTPIYGQRCINCGCDHITRAGSE